MTETQSSVEVGFRFLNLDDEALPSLQMALGATRLRTGRHYASGKLVAVFELSESLNRDDLSKFIGDHRVASTDYEVGISLVTDAYRGEVTMPSYALQMFRELGGQIGFSFVAVGSTKEQSDAEVHAPDLPEVSSATVKKRENRPKEEVYRKELAYFTIANLSESVLPDLETALRRIDLKFEPTDQHGKVGVQIEIREPDDLAAIRAFVVDHAVSPHDHGLRMHVETDRDNGGILVPTYLANYIRKMGAQLVFSFVTIGRPAAGGE